MGGILCKWIRRCRFYCIRTLNPNAPSLAWPPSFFQDAAAAEAKSEPDLVFAEKWLEWLPASTRAPCKEGLLKAIQFVLNTGMLDPDPEARPQTVKAARGALQQALGFYELHEAAEQTREEELGLI